MSVPMGAAKHHARWFCLLAAYVLLAAGCQGDGTRVARRLNMLRGDPYPLDERPRKVPAGEKPGCPEDLTYVVYRGERIRYARPVRIAEAFQPRLQSLERVVERIATQHYGRAPARLWHFGARACRSVRGRAGRLSEHALGNALDLNGFSFSRLPKSQTLPAGVDPVLRRAFRISVREHWFASDESNPIAQRHAAFWRSLVRELKEQDVFRGYVGPGAPGHDNHLHLDCGPWRHSRI